MLFNTTELKYNEASNQFVCKVVDPSLKSDITSGTVNVQFYNPDGDAVGSAIGMSYDSAISRMKCTVDTSTVADWPESIAENWSNVTAYLYKVEVTLVGASPLNVRNYLVSVVKEPWYPTITTSDLMAESPQAAYYEDDSSSVDYMDYIKQAEFAIRMRLLSRPIPLTAGMFFNKSALDMCLLYKALSMMLSRQDGNPGYDLADSDSQELSAYYDKMYNDIWTELLASTFLDLDQDGIIDELPTSIGTSGFQV